MSPRRVLKPGFRLGAAFRAQFSDDGSRLVTLGMRPAVWDVAGRCKLGTTPLLSHASHADFSPDGTRLAVKSTAGIIMIVDVASLEEVAPRYGAEYGEGSRIRFSPCGEFLIDGSWSGHLLVRAVETGEVVWSEHRPDHGVFRLSTALGRSWCLYDRIARSPGPWLHCLREWPFTGDATELFGLGPRRDSAIAEDGKRLALGGHGLEIYDISDPQNCRGIASRPGYHKAITWNLSGESLAAVSDGTGTVYSSDLEILHSEPLEYPSDTSWSPSGELIAFGDWSQGIVIAWPLGKR